MNRNLSVVVLLILTMFTVSCGPTDLIGDEPTVEVEPTPEPGPSPSSAPSCEKHKGCKIIKRYSDRRHFKVDCGHDD